MSTSYPRDDIQYIDKQNYSYNMSPIVHDSKFQMRNLSKSTKSLEDCQRECLNDNKCISINYTPSTSECFTGGAEISSSTTSGIKNGYLYDTLPISSLAGTFINDAGLLKISPSECEKRCTINPECEAYKHNGTFCTLMKLDPKKDSVHSWKTLQYTETPLSDNDYAIYKCCTGDKSCPESSQCDVKMAEICKSNPKLSKCQCINRENNYQFTKVKNMLQQAVGSNNLNDKCWYEPCKSGNYLPENMKTNNTCPMDQQCTITDIYNPDIYNNCIGLRQTKISNNNIMNNPNRVHFEGFETVYVTPQLGAVQTGINDIRLGYDETGQFISNVSNDITSDIRSGYQDITNFLDQTSSNVKKDAQVGWTDIKNTAANIEGDVSTTWNRTKNWFSSVGNTIRTDWDKTNNSNNFWKYLLTFVVALILIVIIIYLVIKSMKDD